MTLKDHLILAQNHSNAALKEAIRQRDNLPEPDDIDSNEYADYEEKISAFNGIIDSLEQSDACFSDAYTEVITLE